MWQVPEMAKIIGDFGYNVDVLEYDAQELHLPNKYQLLLDIFPQNHQVYESSLTDNCLKILYSTGSSPEWQNSRHTERVQALNARRGAALPLKNFARPFGEELNLFDAMFLFGNRFTLDTYGDLPIKDIYFITNSAYDLPAIDPAHKSPNTFLYLATYPQTLKGLDLLLEVFAKCPDLNLVVCSQFQYEKDFCALYEQELYHTTNILPIGVVDVTSDLFQKIRQVASYLVLPSCSEAMSGSVLTALSAGLIPIASRICGFTKDEIFLLPDCSIDGIADTLRSFAQKPRTWILEQSVRMRELYEAKYTPAHFSASFRNALQGVLGS
jgi:glycosyltransferase involved in cell wall biosynthesis